MSDGSAVFYWSSKKKEWSPIALSSNFLLKGVTRLAVNNGMTKLAVVVDEAKN